MNKKAACLAVLALCVSLRVAAERKPQPLPPMSPEKWRADVDALGRELPKRHKNAFHTITREQFAAEIASLRAKADKASDAEMIVGLMQVAAKVGDGHTYVRLPSSVRQFPLGIALIEDAYRVVRRAGAAAELVGAITSGRTFSAALKNAIDFRDVAHATLVGETIGERPNSYSENDELLLPNSKIEMSYSTRYYTFTPNNDGLITPHREIKPTWADWVAGRDPVLEWIVAQPASPQ